MKAASRIDELTQGGFQHVIDDEIAAANPSQVGRVLVCSGKVYYDLKEERAKRYAGSEHEVAIVRVEQIYPWPEAKLAEIFGRYASAKARIWVQEEPRNMGPWTFVRDRIQAILGDKQKIEYAGRAEAASPAVGSPRVHRAQLQALLDEAFGED